MSDVKAYRSQSDYSQEQVTRMIYFADKEHILLFDVMKRVEQLMCEGMDFDEAFKQAAGTN